MVELEILSNRTTIWRGRKGFRFALRIGRQSRHGITSFVIRHTQQLPVTVSVIKLKRTRSNKVYPVTVNDCRKVGLTYKKYFILINFEDILENIQRNIGDESLSPQELVLMQGQFYIVIDSL